MHNYRVAVLMSTYNGDKFIYEQIKSVLAQEDIDVSLFIRDDGSNDDTLEIIRHISLKDHRIHVCRGKNLGVGNSFMRLVYKVNNFDYYAFCDQDDIWLPNKIIQAIKKIKDIDGAVLYVSNQILVDAEGRVMGLRFSTNPDLSYLQILCQNKATGCTMVWNNTLQNKLRDPQHRPSSDLLKKRIHDVWVAMVATINGKIIYDENGYIEYRQHEGNVVGVKKATKRERAILLANKMINKDKRNGRSGLAREIVRCFPKESSRYPLLIICSQPNKFYNKSILIKKRHCFIEHSGETNTGFILKVIFNFI